MSHTQLVLSPKLRHKVDRYISIGCVVLFTTTPIMCANILQVKHSSINCKNYYTFGIIYYVEIRQKVKTENLD